MKRTFIYYNLLLALTLVLVGCIRDPEPLMCEEEPSPPGKFSGTYLAKAINSLEVDISDSGVVPTSRVSMFDQAGNYLSAQVVNISQQVTVRGDKQGRLALVGWGNLSAEGQSQITLREPDNIGLWRVSLIKLAQGNYRSPDDLFYGAAVIALMESNTKPPVELRLRRRVAAIAINTIGLQSRLTDPAAELKYIVRGTSTALDFKADPTDDLAVYWPTAAINSDGELEVKPFRTFASSASGRVTVELYAGGALLFAASNDLNGLPFNAINDRILYIMLDMDKSINSTFKLAEWDDKAINQNF